MNANSIMRSLITGVFRLKFLPNRPSHKTRISCNPRILRKGALDLAFTKRSTDHPADPSKIGRPDT
jgi:hypothetical protein